MYSKEVLIFRIMTYTHHNHLENLAIDYEHDAAYADMEIDPEDLDIAAETKLILHGDTSDGALEGCSYVSVDPHYVGLLSPGQQRLYEILVALQEGAIYAMTSIGKLSHLMGLENPLACAKRLENLQTLGVISGFKM